MQKNHAIVANFDRCEMLHQNSLLKIIEVKLFAFK